MAKDKPLTLEELTEFYRSEIKPRFEKLEAGQKRLEVGQDHMHKDLKELKGDTPSRKEHDDLKSRVTVLERTN